MAGQHEAEAPDEKVPGAQGLSAFAAKILDQLSLSAWLPAAFGVANVTVLLDCASHNSLDLTATIDRITAHPVRVLILVLPCLILSTLVTQAFSFQAIRLLEGYWRLPPMSWLRGPMIAYHCRRQGHLRIVRHRVATKAVNKAIPNMIQKSVPLAVIRAYQAQAHDGKRPELNEDERAVLNVVPTWRGWCSPARLARVDRLQAEEESYPKPWRVLPTKLGNVLRSTEDKLELAGHDLQGFAYRGREVLPQRVAMQHDQFRTRLDMYSTLVFTCLFLAIFTLLIMRESKLPTLEVGLITGSYLALAGISYAAGLASARGYCTILMEMQRRLAGVSGG